MVTNGNENWETMKRKGIPKPPDGGWGWLVVAASFLIHIIGYGVTYAYTFGVLLLYITYDYRESRMAISWIISIMGGIFYGSGPIAGAVINKLGCRATGIIGSFVAALGFAISYFAQSYAFLYLSIGLVGGLGACLIYLPAIVSVATYFDKRRGFATGIAVCGSGFGSTILDPLIGKLVHWLEGRWVLVITSGIIFSCFILSCIFKPVKETEDNEDEEETPTPFPHPILKPVNEAYISSQSAVEPSEKQVYFTQNLNPAQTGSCGNLDHISNKKAHLAEIKAAFNRVTDFTILKDRLFLLFAISNFFICIGYIVAYVCLQDLARVHSIEGARFLLSIVGFSKIVSSVVSGYLSDKPWMNRLYLYNGAIIVCGLATAIAPHVCLDLNALRVCSGVIGASAGVYVTLTSVILVDLLGLEKLTNAFGLLLWFQGVAIVAGPYVFGVFINHFDHYKYGYGLAGGMIAISGLMLFLIPLLQKKRGNGVEEDSEATEQQAIQMQTIPKAGV